MASSEHSHADDKFTQTEVEILFLLTIFGTLMWICASWIFVL